MTPELWQKVKAIFNAAIQQESAERPAFLENACGADEALRREVESLIAAYEKAGSFIDGPAYEVAAHLFVNEHELQVGQALATMKSFRFSAKVG